MIFLILIFPNLNALALNRIVLVVSTVTTCVFLYTICSISYALCLMELRLILFGDSSEILKEGVQKFFRGCSHFGHYWKPSNNMSLTKGSLHNFKFSYIQHKKDKTDQCQDAWHSHHFVIPGNHSVQPAIYFGKTPRKANSECFK